jgi:hypothetical protein
VAPDIAIWQNAGSGEGWGFYVDGVASGDAIFSGYSNGTSSPVFRTTRTTKRLGIAGTGSPSYTLDVNGDIGLPFNSVVQLRRDLAGWTTIGNKVNMDGLIDETLLQHRIDATDRYITIGGRPSAAGTLTRMMSFHMGTGAIGVGVTKGDSTSLIEFASTSKFVLLPRMTQAQRNTITNRIATGNSSGTIAAGSGYTEGVYNNIALTGGSGSGARATIGVNVAGQVGGVTITVSGTGYQIGDVLTATGFGGGSGFTFTVTIMVVVAGSTFYCTDCTASDSSTGVEQTWNGTTWKNKW